MLKKRIKHPAPKMQTDYIRDFNTSPEEILEGEPVNKVTRGFGDFGHVVTNPIPVNGPTEEMKKEIL